MSTIAEKEKVVKTPEITAEVLDLSGKLQKEIKIDREGVGLIDSEAYVNSLPEGITRETIEIIQKHNTTFIAAGLHAFGTKAIDMAKKHDGMTSASLSIATVGKDTIDYNWKRTREVPSPGTSETKTTYGTTTIGVTTHATSNTGELARIKKTLTAQAFAALGN
jgi:hypothetical protein